MPRRMLTPELMTGEMETFLNLTGLGAMLPDPAAVVSMMTAFGLALQDIDSGPAKTCPCDPCTGLRATLGTLERLLDEFFRH